MYFRDKLSVYDSVQRNTNLEGDSVERACKRIHVCRNIKKSVIILIKVNNNVKNLVKINYTNSRVALKQYFDKS